MLGIDPGPSQSAYCYIAGDYRPVLFGKIPNDMLLERLQTTHADRTAVEWPESRGMPVGAPVFDMCMWIGRFWQTLIDYSNSAHYPQTGPDLQFDLIKATTIRIHVCGTARAKKGNISVALVDRFAPGEANHGKGTKRQPSWFYGFAADVWSAYAVGVTALDQLHQPTERTKT